MNTLGNRLRRAREDKRLSQVDVFKRSGINNKTLSRYENGGTEPDTDSLKRLAELYGVTADWLIGGENKKESAGALPKSNVDEAVKRIEKELGISLDDDPDIVKGIENYLLTMGKMKKKSEQ